MSEDVLSAAEQEQQVSCSKPVRRQFKESSVSKWAQTAGKTASSGQSIPEYQVIGDEWFLETLNGVLKAFGVYRWSYVTEEGNLTGRETISKLKYKAFS